MSSSLDNFLSQLADWTGQIIETGRTPFRKVEISPPLLHPPCPDLPHQVLWINRDSHMAGGLILLPDGNPDHAVLSGTRLAEALGLKNCACWDRRQIEIWELENGSAARQECIQLSGVRSAAQFRQHLHALLERLKILAVANAPKNEDLTALYLANLLQLALLEVAPGLDESLRALQPANEPVWDGGRSPGTAKALATLCRLLAVGHADLLPTTVVAEGLERALHFACSSLPDNLAGVLSMSTGEPPLPVAPGARLHHVWRRLQQLGCLKNKTLLAEATEWLQPTVERLQEVNLKPQQAGDGEPRRLALNPTWVPTAPPPEGEVALPAVLVWRSLLRWFRGIPQPRQQSTEIGSLAPDFHPGLVQAALLPSPPASRQQRPRLATALRLAWPSRRFALPANTPRWHYDLLHLLGRAGDKAELELCMPGDLVSRPEGEALWDLLRSGFYLQALHFDHFGSLTLKAKKSPKADGPCEVSGDKGARHRLWSELRTRSLGYLQILLHWPDTLLQLVDRDLLRLAAEHPFPEDLEAEARYFWQSSWGQQVAAWSGVPVEKLQQAPGHSYAPRTCYPHPDRLRRLKNLSDDLAPGGPRFDAEIALWIGTELADENWPAAPETRTGASPVGRQSQTELVAEIESRILVDGLPQFPGHYLYDHYRPRLGRFELQGELVENGQFFGQISLRDQDQREFQVDSPALAASLILISTCQNGELELPLDEDVAGDILRRYLADLSRLRDDLERESRRLLGDPAAARRLAGRAWKNWRLPDPASMERAKALFPGTKEVE